MGAADHARQKTLRIGGGRLAKLFQGDIALLGDHGGGMNHERRFIGFVFAHRFGAEIRCIGFDQQLIQRNRSSDSAQFVIALKSTGR